MYDHTIQVIDTVESYRDIVASMLDLYLSSVSNRMNSVMKVLTIIATIFILLTFVAVIYGMNFKNMPELEWRWGVCRGSAGDGCCCTAGAGTGPVPARPVDGSVKNGWGDVGLGPVARPGVGLWRSVWTGCPS